MGLWGKVTGKDKYWRRRREEEAAAQAAAQQRQLAADQNAMLAGSAQADSGASLQAGGEAITSEVDLGSDNAFKKKKKLGTASSSLGIV